MDEGRKPHGLLPHGDSKKPSSMGLPTSEDTKKLCFHDNCNMSQGKLAQKCNNAQHDIAIAVPTKRIQ